MATKYKGGSDAVDYAFEVLDSVRQGDYTKFQLAFDVNRRVIYFTSPGNPERRSLSLEAFDYSASTKSRILDMNTKLSGDVGSSFVDYSSAKNEELIVKAWHDLGYGNVYVPALRLVSRYPETFKHADSQ